jgi:hypothetical protein
MKHLLLLFTVAVFISSCKKHDFHTRINYEKWKAKRVQLQVQQQSGRGL